MKDMIFKNQKKGKIETVYYEKSVPSIVVGFKNGVLDCECLDRKRNARAISGYAIKRGSMEFETAEKAMPAIKKLALADNAFIEIFGAYEQQCVAASVSQSLYSGFENMIVPKRYTFRNPNKEAQITMLEIVELLSNDAYFFAENRQFYCFSKSKIAKIPEWLLY